jgi:hypothetical protein
MHLDRDCNPTFLRLTTRLPSWNVTLAEMAALSIPDPCPRRVGRDPRLKLQSGVEIDPAGRPGRLHPSPYPSATPQADFNLESAYILATQTAKVPNSSGECGIKRMRPRGEESFLDGERQERSLL